VKRYLAKEQWDYAPAYVEKMQMAAVSLYH
jgi:hypothetical protein